MKSCIGPPSRLCIVFLLLQLRWPAHVAAQLSLPFIRHPMPQFCRSSKDLDGFKTGTVWHTVSSSVCSHTVLG